MDIVLLKNESDEKAWTKYIDSTSHSSFFHHIGWKKVLEKTYGFQGYHLMAIERDEVTGVLPLILGKSFFFGSFLATGLYCSHGGVCTEKPDVRQRLVERAIELTRATGAGYLEIKNYGEKCGKLITKEQYCTLVLELDGDPQQIWGNKVQKYKRRDVTRARKKGLKAEVGGMEYFDDYYSVISRNMRDLGTPAHSYRFYRTLFEEFEDRNRFVLVKTDGRTVAAVNFFLFKDTVYPQWGGSIREYLKMYPNELMYWKMIEYSCENGFRRLDFGRSRWNSGTFQFKSHFGAEPEPLYYQYYLNKRKRLPDIDPTNPRYRLSILIWKRLPLFLASAVGSRIIRFVP